MRTNPNNQSPNPAKRWFAWDGSKGDLKWYDKETQSEVRRGLPFPFILLDRLATVRGWHDSSEGGLYSNEVRKTMEEPFVVRAHKMKDVIAQGFYCDIKDKVKAAGGKFNINLYIAFKDEGELTIGSLMLRGAPMSAWIEFEKASKAEIFKKGVTITEFEEGKKGGVTFRKPVFILEDLPEEIDDKAGELQKELQGYLRKYLSRVQDSAVKIADEAEEELEPEETVEEEHEREPLPF